MLTIELCKAQDSLDFHLYSLRGHLWEKKKMIIELDMEFRG